MSKIIGKLAGANFRPKRLLGQPDATRELMLGTLIGVARGFKVVTMPNGEQFTGYTGQFQFHDADPTVEPMSSGVLYLPAGVDDMLKDAGNEVFAGGGMIKLAMEVSVFRAENPAGYSWAFNQLEQEIERPDDAFAELKKFLPTNRAAAIENKGEPAAASADADKAKAPAEKGKAA